MVSVEDIVKKDFEIILIFSLANGNGRHFFNRFPLTLVLELELDH